MTDRIIACIKWGTLYPADYVNVLYSACRKAMRQPFTFLCLTDDAAGLSPGIESRPIPDIGLTRDEMFRRGAWPKVGLFDAHFHGLRGRCLFVDLDMMILRDLDAFFGPADPFIAQNMGPNWGRGDNAIGAELGTCIFAFDLGAQGQIAEAFRADKARGMGFHNEQSFVEGHLTGHAFWPDGWVISFKRELRRPVGLDLILPPRRPPQTAKVLAFHGRPRPMHLISGQPYFWDRFPHLGHGKVRWLADYWQANGGRL